MQSAQKLENVPKLTESQKKTMEVLDEIIMRPELMYTMYLEPGDMQILNNYTMFHSRTHYEDFDAPEEKRCLFRLWLAPPDLYKDASILESILSFHRTINRKGRHQGSSL